jgi:hypothetical protein
MDAVFTQLIANEKVWSSLLGGLAGRIGATSVARGIKGALEERFPWLRDPELQKSFFEALAAGVDNYQRDRGKLVAARSAARVLSDCVKTQTPGLDLAAVLELIFSESFDEALLARIISTHPVVFEDALVQTNDVVKELRILIRDYLRPSFLQHPRFTQIVGFSQVIKLLQEIRSSLQPNVDLVRLRSEYLEKIAEKFEIIPLQGISPKVGKNTIGVRMEDVFVPIKLKPDMTVYHHLHLSRARRRQKLSSLLVESPGETGQRKLKGPEIRSALAEISKGQGKSLLSTILTWSSLELEAFGSVGIDKLLSVPQVVLQGDPGSDRRLFQTISQTRSLC